MTFFTTLSQQNLVKPLTHPDIRHTCQEHNHKKRMTCQPAWILILLSCMILGTVKSSRTCTALVANLSHMLSNSYGIFTLRALVHLESLQWSPQASLMRPVSEQRDHLYHTVVFLAASHLRSAGCTHLTRCAEALTQIHQFLT